MQKLHYIVTILVYSYAARRNANAVVVVITNLTTLPYDSEFLIASRQGSLWHIENPTNIIYVYSALLSYVYIDVFKYATLLIDIGSITQRGPESISCNISSF